ncbi:MAG: methyltransferase [Bacteroidetes bacterium]|jgi:tRNA1Val (adenine37-N6)-methyltransferase|nr:methyltransferase [Bacteroidota bacterium]
MSSRPFHFKHFSLFHHQSTMKVGTDAVLLGSWVSVEKVSDALDIGTGCGILPLMLAQRSVNQVDAVELDASSAREAAYNFSCSQWHRQLQVYEMDIRRFVDVFPNKKYDLIISNPPFFTNSFKGEQPRRNQARHTDSLSFDDILNSAKKSLNPEGSLALVLPYNEGVSFINSANAAGIFLKEKLLIVPIEGRQPNRLNLLFSFKSVPDPVTKTFTIRNLDGSFTKQYKDLLQDFYLGL